ncbi:Glu/Leu/Phe/Val dehydrogenase dimerization domain-containing protein [Streptomyces sp. AgN23]|uniref:Glu/Leu/Phe/Val dehydrogenase family protein n=1 Tax=Streptomyces sp. AgN23 TaxID=1188315 RepID=UPI001B3241F3|nr:Glu/Leu/Phe/Val dehydrogenase dimerization domain-containing protein [Streptomyces sp. AgN23]QTI87283.1 Glu/Leu/Phe/Val dehydrogenase [Streptomyces sp. AgN23]
MAGPERGEEVYGVSKNDAVDWEGERTLHHEDEQTGLRAVVAIHDTTLGPGLGGVRFAAYPTARAAAREAQRLAEAMTWKNTLAGLPYGGAKAVITDTGGITDRAALMAAFGRFTATLGGAYVPGVDLGTSTADLAVMARTGATVSCATEDPSPWTAMGVLAAVQAAARHVWGHGGLADRRVLVQGAGHVGSRLVRSLAAAGARVIVADTDADRAVTLARETGALCVPADRALASACDIFVPCARARVLDEATARTLTARIVAGAANDQLADDTVVRILTARHITYVPDFLASAGGVIRIHAAEQGWDTARTAAAIAGIGDRVTRVLDEGHRTGDPVTAARDQARRILRSAARPPGPLA